MSHKNNFQVAACPYARIICSLSILTTLNVKPQNYKIVDLIEIYNFGIKITSFDSI